MADWLSICTVPLLTTILQQLGLTECVADKFSEQAHTAAIFLDVSKAYGTVWTTGLIYTLHAATLSLLLPAPCLTDRKFRVAMEGTFSDWKTARAGVPQGAVLDPLLCNIHVGDIPRRPGIEITQFADDTAACTSNKNINYAVNNLQRYMPDLKLWQYKWGVKINTDKSAVIIFTERRQLPRNKNGRRKQNIWGIHFGRSLTRKAHIKAMENKAVQRFVALYSIVKSPTLNRKIKTHLYKSVIRPIPLYGAPAWGCAAISNMKKLKVIQNKILRSICDGDRCTSNNITPHSVRRHIFK
jgi:hypothetical protein